MMKGKQIIYLIPVYIFLLGGVIIGAFYANKAVTVMSESRPIAARKTIIIDAGHGGEDGGATSCTGVLESQINLEIALKLDDLLHLLGVNTVMIRTTDISVYTEGETIAAKKISDLKERVRIVNQTNNAVLLSIHQNNFSDDRYSGAQVFYAPTQGSKELAQFMQSNLVSVFNPGSNRQIKKADSIYLMKHADCTAILIECGFLSNHHEEALLRSNVYQQKLCCVIAVTVSSFLSNT